VITSFKDMFNVTGEIDFGGTNGDTHDSRNSMKLEDFADMMQKMFNQILSDLDRSQKDNAKLLNNQKAQKRKILQL
jgi:hypothetical protein